MKHLHWGLGGGLIPLRDKEASSLCTYTLVHTLVTKALCKYLRTKAELNPELRALLSGAQLHLS